jgi:hypothetical protein
MCKNGSMGHSSLADQSHGVFFFKNGSMEGLPEKCVAKYVNCQIFAVEFSTGIPLGK